MHSSNQRFQTFQDIHNLYLDYLFIVYIFPVIRPNGDFPVKYGMRLNSEAKYVELKENLYELCGVNPSRLLVAEVACCQIRNFLVDDSKISSSTATELFAYELPDTSKVLEDSQSEKDAG